MPLIQYPLIHLVIVGVLVWFLGRALWTGEVKVNRSVFRRQVNPVGYWLGIALACFLIFAVGGPVVLEGLK